MHIWEAHKSHIRGTLIKLSTHRTMMRGQHIDKILTHICDLEAPHEHSLSITKAAKWKALREEVLALLSEKVKAQFCRYRRLMYEFGNRPGSQLARAIH